MANQSDPVIHRRPLGALTIGSLFSGIGGLELGLERAGLGPVVWQVEKDAYCRAVLAKHWPDATRYEDVKDVGRANLVPVDVISGGFPCQDISYAGDGAGLAGERSGLWWEFARIIREMGPRYVVVENVSALLDRGFGDVLGTLAAFGYDAEWDCIPASSIGAPHQRDRIFIVAHAKHGGLSQRRRTAPPELAMLNAVRVCRDESQGGAQQAPTVLGDANVARLEGHDVGACATVEADSRRADPRTTGVCDGRGWWALEPNVGRVAHGVPRRVDRLRAVGNAVVPQVAEVVGRVVLALDAERAREPGSPSGGLRSQENNETLTSASSDHGSRNG